MKKYFIILFLLTFIVSSIAFASWWNPFSWGIFHRKEVAPQVQVETQKTPEEKINDLQKQLDDLKKQQQVSNTQNPVIKKEVKKITPVVVNPVNPVTPKTETTQAVVDVCPEIEGIQSIVPMGYIKYGSGPCVLNTGATTVVNKSDSTVKEPIKVGLFFMKSTKAVNGSTNTYTYPLTLTNNGNEQVIINSVDMNVVPQGETGVIKVSVIVGDMITSKDAYSDGSDTRSVTINLGNSFVLQPFLTNTLMIKISGENIPANYLTVQSLRITGTTPTVFDVPISTL